MSEITDIRMARFKNHLDNCYIMGDATRFTYDEIELMMKCIAKAIKDYQSEYSTIHPLLEALFHKVAAPLTYDEYSKMFGYYMIDRHHRECPPISEPKEKFDEAAYDAELEEGVAEQEADHVLKKFLKRGGRHDSFKPTL